MLQGGEMNSIPFLFASGLFFVAVAPFPSLHDVQMY